MSDATSTGDHSRPKIAVREISDEDLRVAFQAARDAAEDREYQGAASLGSALRALVKGDDDPLQALQAGLEYHLRLRGEAGAEQAPYGPAIEMGGVIYPPPLEVMPDEVLALWARAAATPSAAVARGRFADLLGGGRYGDRPHEWAQAAVDAYVDIPADGFGGRMEQLDSLHRALDLATQLNDGERRDRVIVSLVELAERELAGDPAPGVVISVVGLLAGRPPDQRPDGLTLLVERVMDLYRADAFMFESIGDIAASLLPSADRAALRDAQVQAFAVEARSAGGFRGFALLHHALELAERHGLPTRAHALRVQLQNIDPESLDLHEVSAEIEVPREAIERFIAAVVGDDDLSAALTRFGNQLPTGQLEDNLEHVRNLAREFPIQILATTLALGPAGSLLRVPEDFQLIRHEALSIEVFATLAVEILARIRDRYTPGGLDDASRRIVVELFTTQIITAEVADRIAHALHLYLSGDYDASAFSLAPRIERVVRELASAAHLPITQSPRRNGAPGGVRGLGDILASLEGVLDESWRRYLRGLLAEPTGVNLRNRVGHALMDVATDRDAAALLHAICYLRLLEVSAHPSGAAE